MIKQLISNISLFQPFTRVKLGEGPVQNRREDFGSGFLNFDEDEERDRRERDRRERERVEKERLERERLDRERLDRERERVERERVERERRERE